MSKGTAKKTLFLILAITGFVRVAIFAVPIVGMYLYTESAYEEVKE